MNGELTKRTNCHSYTHTHTTRYNVLFVRGCTSSCRLCLELISIAVFRKKISRVQTYASLVIYKLLCGYIAMDCVGEYHRSSKNCISLAYLHLAFSHNCISITEIVCVVKKHINLAFL